MGALAIEKILEGAGLTQKAAARELLSGLGAKLTRASDLPAPGTRDPFATKVPALDRLLAGGLPRGALTEIAGRRSCGRFSIGISTLAAATSAGESAALVDLGGHFDPQSAEEAGVDLERLLWVRPAKLKEAVASAEMLLATGFPLVVLDLGLAPVRGRFVPDAAWVRLTRAARDRRAALLVLAPYRVSGIAAETAVAAGAARAMWRGAGRSPRLLEGLASRLTLAKDARAREGAAEEMTMAAAPSPVVGAAWNPAPSVVGAPLAGARLKGKGTGRPPKADPRSVGNVERSSAFTPSPTKTSYVAVRDRAAHGDSRRRRDDGLHSIPLEIRYDRTARRDSSPASASSS